MSDVARLAWHTRSQREDDVIDSLVSSTLRPFIEFGGPLLLA